MTPLLALAIVFSAVAAYTDFRRGEIANWLTTSAFAAGVAASAAVAVHAHLGARGALAAAAGALVGGLACAVLPLILWRKGVLGGGDLKLFAALGALCHSRLGIEIELSSFIAGSAFAVVHLAYRGTLLSTLQRVGRSAGAEGRSWFRFAPSIFVATLWVAFTRGGSP